MRFVSIIITVYCPTEERKAMAIDSINSLLKSTSYPFELIIVDNGGDFSLTDFVLDLNKQGIVSTYIRNARNMHFGYARNQGIAVSRGYYVCIADNDILYKGDWLTECIKVLDENPREKFYATPIDYPNQTMARRYTTGKLVTSDTSYSISMRAGSNCFVIRRKDLDKIGHFKCHRVAGTLWTDRAVKMGYSAIVVPGNLIEDIGLRRGYNLKDPIPVSLKLSNGNYVYFNSDEFKVKNPDLTYYEEGC